MQVENDVKFYNRQVLNQFLSTQQLKPVYENKLFIKISHPGESLNVLDREATEQDKRVYYKHLKKLSNLSVLNTDGTPLELILGAHMGFVTLLKEYNIHTIEQLSEISHEIKLELGPEAEKYQNYAIAYLNGVSKGAAWEHLKAENDTLKAKISDQQRTIENLSLEIANLRQRYTGQIG